MEPLAWQTQPPKSTSELAGGCSLLQKKHQKPVGVVHLRD